MKMVLTCASLVSSCMSLLAHEHFSTTCCNHRRLELFLSARCSRAQKYHRDEKKEARTHPQEVSWYEAQSVVMCFKAQVTDARLPSCLHLHAVVFQAHPVLSCQTVHLMSHRSTSFEPSPLLPSACG